MDELEATVLLAIRPDEPKVERLGFWPKDARKHPPRRPRLVFSVSLGPDDHRVDAERHVVDEDPIGDQPETDPYFLGVPEGVQGTDRVVRIETEIFGEVIPSPDWHAREPQIVRQGDLGDLALRAVTASHAKDVGSELYRLLGTLLQIVPGAEGDILDPSSAGLVAQGDPLGLPAAGLGVRQQHRMGARTDPAAGDTYPCRSRNRSAHGAPGAHRCDSEQDNYHQSERRLAPAQEEGEGNGG